MKRKTKPATAMMLRWLASKGIEISPDEFRRIEGKFHRRNLPAKEQTMVDKILIASAGHEDEFLALRREIERIENEL